MKKGLFVLLAILISGCSEYTEPQESDIAVFERFLSEVTISSDKNTINVASLYQPQDKLFDAVLAIQRNHWSKAIKELTPYAEKKDPDALFWLAQISYGSNPTENIKAGKMMLESAQLGSPYAALMLDPDNIICQRYFSRYCDKKWVGKAKGIFAIQAEKGDVRAIYYTERFKEKHDDYIKAIIYAANNKYYYPIVDYSKDILIDNNSTKKMKELAIELLNYAAVNNFIPAYDLLFKYDESLDNNEYNLLLKQSIKLGSNVAWNRRATSSVTDKSLSNIDKYIIAKATYDFNRDKFALSFIKKLDVSIISHANEEAKKMVKSIPKVIYIDGTHPTVD
ncbi:TPA: hypothetical protein ACX6SA_000002 [Photobacterium damselae]|uniref:hypothetical protein n=1 Tax=Photobacterium damselae TaxID=38293 RepID=UPI001EE0592E|nr:hypothetical protein [Photobacterium damselae]MCG3814943.1 hypothetical protein [Photobacterium damselae]